MEEGEAETCAPKANRFGKPSKRSPSKRSSRSSKTPLPPVPALAPLDATALYVVGEEDKEEGPAEIPQRCGRPCSGGVAGGRPRARRAGLPTGSGAADQWVAVLEEMLERHCDNLAQHVDRQLEAHLGDGSKAVWRQSAKADRSSATRRQSGYQKLSPRMTIRSSVVSCDGVAADPPERASCTTERASRATVSSMDSCAEGVSRTLSDRPHMMTFQESENLKRMNAKSNRMNDFHIGDIGAELFHLTGLDQRANWGCSRYKKWIESQWFEFVICLLIISNAILFGYEVEVFLRAGMTELPVPFRIVEHAYTACFTLELMMRFSAYGPTKLLCTGGERFWNSVDLFLVLTSLTAVFLQEFSGGSIHGLDNTRMTRLFRASRIFRVVRIMKFFRPLRVLLDSIVGTLRSIFWTLFLLSMLIYVFGVVFTISASQALETHGHAPHTRALEQYFGSLGASLATFFMSITGGVDWSDCMKALLVMHPGWTAVFLGYIAFSNFAVLNVVTGIVCQTAIESAQRDQEVIVDSHLAVKNKYVKQLQDIFKDIDTSGSGYITLHEFEERMQEERLITYFETMDLTVEQAWNLFKLLDVEENHSIDFEQFVSGCLRLRGTARGIDLHMLMYESKWAMSKLMIILKQMEDLERVVMERQS